MDEKKIKNKKQDEDAELSKDYNLGSLLIFVLPSILTFVFIAVYQIVDGLFIEKYVGPYAISAVNLYYPVISLLLAIGLMMGTGGNAMIVELIGEGKKEEADRRFSQTLMTAVLISVVFAVVGIVFSNPIMRLLGASDVNIEYLKFYYLVLTACAPAIMLQTVLGVLIIGEGKTVTAGLLTIVGGMLNMVLDYVFMGHFGLGTKGAAFATVIGYIVPVLYALYFYSPVGDSKYHFGFVKIELKKILKLCYNGSSEMVSNLAAGVTALFMNRIAYKFHGDVGVSVVSVFLYVQFIAMAIFMGMTTAVEPLFSYHYGNGNTHMRKKIFKLTMILISIFTVIVTAVVAIFNSQIVGIFFQSTGESKEFFELAYKCLLFAIPACIFTGYNIFVSGMFTAFSNGTISAMLSFVRTFVILAACIFGLSAFFGSNGLWASWAVSEALSLILSIVMIVRYRRKYF